ncbi:MAG TPA: tetratricopeptide repeat protein [Dissulfurispiraceae bacterium]|nr:tetratricopeptide repeat protein [Dissulfurispiraceae bacterium]
MNTILRAAVLSCLAVLISSCALFGIYSAQDEFDRGMSYFNRGQYEAAIPYFEKATDLDPNFTDAYLLLGRSYLNLGKWALAVPPLRAALQLSPEKTKREISNLLVDALMGGGLSDLDNRIRQIGPE